MILFLGCSLTWGQGLYIEKWLSEGKDEKFCNRNSVPIFDAELLSYEDDLYRRENHFPNIVSQHFNRSYSCKWFNGGKNDDIVKIIDNLSKGQADKIDLVVIQFTDMTRDDEFAPISLNEWGELIEVIPQYQILKIHKKMTELKLPWLALCWHEEHSNFFNKFLQNKLIKVRFQEKTYRNIASMNQFVKDSIKFMNQDEKDEVTTFELCDKYPNINDGHPTLEWHEVVAESIIKKIQDEDIQFRKYN